MSGCRPVEERAALVICNGAEPESLDPALVTSQPDLRIVSALFEGLTRFDPKTAKPEPALAHRWQISDSGTTYRFFLRTNAVWSTGEPITAEDVVYSWQRVADPATAADYAGQLFFVKNAEAINSGKINDLSALGVQAVDRHTVEVELISPTPFFLDLCAFRTLAVVPRQTIEKHGDRWLSASPLPVSGTYLLEYWRIHDKIRLRRNPRHWDAANIHSELVDFLPMESATTALNLYETGQADIIWDKNLIPNELLDILLRRPDCHTFNYLGTYFIRCNVTRKPFDDSRVRKALALAIDKRRIVERITRAGEEPASHFVPPGTAGYEPAEGVGHDPELARKLLAEAGFAGGKGFPNFRYLFNPSKIHEQIGVELQQMWKQELGINVELRQSEMQVYLAAQSALDYDTCRGSWIGDYNDPNTFLDLFMTNAGNNRTGWSNRRYDEFIRQANMQADAEERMRMMREAEAILVREELPIIPLYFYEGVTLFDPNKIGGIYFNILDEHPIHAIYRVEQASRLEARPIPAKR